MREAVLLGLRSRHVDVVTALEAAMINRSDEDHLECASSHDRVLYSFNVADYCALHRAWLSLNKSHAGIVVALQQRYTIGEELRRLLRLIGTTPAEGMRNRLEFLSSWP